jgi:hypothetical protein
MMVLLRSFAATLLIAASAAASAQMSFPDEHAFIRDYLLPLRTRQAEPPAVERIVAALAAKNFAAGVSLADAVLAAPDDPGESPQYSAYVRSLALLHRGEGNRELGRPWATIWVDLRRAADLGNVRAVRVLLNAFAALRSDRQALGGYQPDAGEIARVYAIAADLGMTDGVAMLADGSDGPPLATDERLYWRLVSRFESRRDAPALLLRQMADAEGERRLIDALARHAMVGAPFEAFAPDLAGRDLVATLYAESQLRTRMTAAFGSRSPRAKTVEPPTLADNFRFLATQASKTGLGDMVLLVPGRARVGSANVHYLDRRIVANELRPGDSLWVTCGALSHTATVFGIDRARDVLLLVDPTWEFWQPSHNECITSLTHQHYRYGFYLPKLKWSEVVPMVDAVGSYRTAEFLGAAGGGLARMQVPSARCAHASGPAEELVGGPLATLRNSEFMRTFALGMVGSEPLLDGASAWRFAPTNAGFYGQVALLAAVDSRDCVRALSLTLRRSLLEDPDTQAFGLKIVSAFFSAGHVGGVPQPEAEETLEGKRRTFEQEAGERHLRIDNLESAGGALLQRVTIR